MSTQDTAAPKRRSSAANRRRRRRAEQAASQAAAAQQPTADAVDGGEATLTRAERKAAARGESVGADPGETPQEKHLRRQQERREAKSRVAEKPKGVKRLVNTDRFEGVQRFSNDTSSEIRKVTWPDRDTTRNLTIVVIALSTILGLALGGIDYVLYQIFEAMT